MAKATVHYDPPPPPPEPVKVIVLELTQLEANVLRSICGSIGGHLIGTWREQSESIRCALAPCTEFDTLPKRPSGTDSEWYLAVATGPFGGHQ
ncbi:MAG: hypothetical protein KGL39_51750 [Patescibacteria group bacterium]|nr:hypothetical protein [Patescibacteria group bacterium]